MVIIVTFLMLLLVSNVSSYYTCIPNSIFTSNGRSCYCDSLGRWTDDKCYDDSRRICMPGKVVWYGCTQCICQENGQLVCSNTECEDPIKMLSFDHQESSLGSSVLIVCTPLQYYYIKCKICKCPSSGIKAHADCIPDSKCDIVEYKTLEEFRVQSKNGVTLKCIPNVMYIFNCYNCLCPVGKYLLPKYCRDKCLQSSPVSKPCMPRTLYKNKCNMCFCPDKGIMDDNLCTHNICDESQSNLLRSKTTKCSPNSFTKPRCLYCECGYENEESCIELDCLQPTQYRKSCSPGDTVPVCIECFCLKNGSTINEYCSKTCSNKIKISIIEKVMNDSLVTPELVNKDLIQHVDGSKCTPNSVYKHDYRYCLCPNDGNTNFNLCTAVMNELMEFPDFKINKTQYEIKIDFNKTCTPNSFVEFDCNTCYCNKIGKIDPDWCTYDNCEALALIQLSRNKTDNTSETCIPGSISVINCNFCICPNNGILKDKSCTKNLCDNLVPPVLEDYLNCEPLKYYLIDCNVCFCPVNGKKNVDKCTKKFCENNFLRSDYCSPGQLFSDGCNVCVCPSNGDTSDRVCTNKTCAEDSVALKQIFRLSQHLLDIPFTDDNTRNFNLCFPGDEFFDGCKLCICPDIGFRDFAFCYDLHCGEETKVSFNRGERSVALHFQTDFLDNRRNYNNNECYTLKYEESNVNRNECIPGSTYIIRCHQCICPDMGSTNNFCRPLPKGTDCEQSLPYAPTGENISSSTLQTSNANISLINTKGTGNKSIENHNHTKYQCTEIGKLMDACYVCDCIANVIVLEHCFKSNSSDCKDYIPKFINKNTETDNI